LGELRSGERVNNPKPEAEAHPSSGSRLLYASSLLSLGVLVAIAGNVLPFNGVTGDMLEFVRHHTFERNWVTVLLALLFWLAARTSALLRAGSRSECF
jgi:hypothetical protein